MPWDHGSRLSGVVPHPERSSIPHFVGVDTLQTCVNRRLTGSTSEFFDSSGADNRDAAGSGSVAYRLDILHMHNISCRQA
jgi:hypothetical protein